MSTISPDDIEKILLRAMNQRPTPEEFLNELEAQMFAVLRQKATLAGSELLNLIVERCIEQRQIGHANDPVLQTFSVWLTNMDAQVNADWAGDIAPNTRERRAHLLDLLQVNPGLRNHLNNAIPPFIEGNILIADRHVPWYTEERKHRDKYYWPSILAYLQRRGIAEASISMIDQATDQILDYVSDPKEEEIYSSRGLVVGYVQSGKTTNINVLIGKSIDSGYRLIIVLAGLTDVLRNQTQRRIDKEVVGKVLIETDEFEREYGYQQQGDWKDFIEHEPQPGHPVGPRIERLTTREFDFNRGRGAAVFSDGWVQADSSVRIVVIKKNAQRLKNLIKELKKMSRESLQALPAIIIDDESDQASINTISPSKRDKRGERKRTLVNSCITDLLKTLPRSQYIGYTATPFANVFINPDDPVDLFPKDFVYALAQPLGYMGVKDFHDLDEEFFPLEDVAEERSKKAKHVRSIDPRNDHELKILLQEAIDSYVLAGAIKLYREDKNSSLKFRHHTMFYTDSTGIGQHETARQMIKDLWDRADFNAAAGLSRLERLYESDLLKHSDDSADSMMFPPGFSVLREYISRSIQKINSHFNGHQTILVVNSANNDMSPDFDSEDIWKIIIGGAKLSRGYTIEGLTTTVFRRGTKAASTLMQMGRWFGYRNGYRDLVRLYISTSEKLGAKRLDLYSAFESICRDEEAFRRELRRYSIPRPDGSRLTPKDIPPLVQNTHPQLKPVAPNMMWNAKLTGRNFGLSRHAFGSLSIDFDELRFNSNLFKQIFNDYGVKAMEFGLKPGDNPFLVSHVPHDRMADVIFKFKRPKVMPNDELFRLFVLEDGHDIKNWLVALPQVGQNRNPRTWQIGDGVHALTVQRSYSETTESFTTVAEDRHRQPCYQITGIKTPDDPDSVSLPIRQLMAEEGLAVLLLYPMHIRYKDPIPPNPVVLPDDTPAIGLEYFLPKNRLPIARYEAARPDRPDLLVVNAVP